MTLRKVYAALNRYPIQTNATLFVHEIKITKGQVYILKVPKRKLNLKNHLLQRVAMTLSQYLSMLIQEIQQLKAELDRSYSHLEKKDG